MLAIKQNICQQSLTNTPTKHMLAIIDMILNNH